MQWRHGESSVIRPTDAVPDAGTAGSPDHPQDVDGSAEGSDRRSSRATRVAAMLMLLAITLAPLLGQAATEVGSLSWDAGGSSDYAGLELDVRSATNADLLLGTSSRLGVRNVGPFHAYWSAPWYTLTGEGAGGMVVAAWLLHAVALVVTVLLIRSTLGDAAGWVAAVALATAWFVAGPAALSDFYNPSWTVPAVLVASVAGGAVATGHWRHLPVLAAAASIGSQVHFVAGPGLLTIAVIAVCLGWRAAKPDWKPIAGMGIVLVVFWSPALADQVVGSANLTRMASAIEAGPGSEDQPLGRPGKSPPREDRARTALELVTLLRPQASAQGTLYGTASQQPAPDAVRDAASVIAIVALAVTAWRRRRRERFVPTVMFLSLVGATITFAVTATLEYGFLVYYLAPLPGYGITLWVAAFLLVADKLHHRHIRYGVVVAVPLVATAAVALPSPQVSELLENGANPSANYSFAREVAQSVPERCHGRGVALRASTDRIADAWTILVALDELDIRGTVPPELEPFVPPDHHRTGEEAAIVDLPAVGDAGSSADPSRQVDVVGCPPEL